MIAYQRKNSTHAGILITKNAVSSIAAGLDIASECVKSSPTTMTLPIRHTLFVDIIGPGVVNYVSAVANHTHYSTPICVKSVLKKRAAYQPRLNAYHTKSSTQLALNTPRDSTNKATFEWHRHMSSAQETTPQLTHTIVTTR